jgi:hypothetical protein
MENEDTFKGGSFGSFINAVLDSTADSFNNAKQIVVETAIPIINEGSRLSANGSETIDDVISSGIEYSKDAVHIVRKQLDEIRNNPTVVINSTKSMIGNAIESGVKRASRAKDSVVDSFERRNEILSDAGDQLSHAVHNPGEVAKKAKRHGEEVIKGAVQGTTNSFKGMYAHLDVGRGDFKMLEQIIDQQSAEFASLKSQKIQIKSGTVNDFNFMDAILVGGDVLHEALSRQIPADILMAYSLQYPKLAESESFREHLEKLTQDGQASFVAAIKGKLFEIQYVDYLNDGHLENGYKAVLSELANQPGYDVEILGPDGHVSNLIQLKATDSISYVKHALERYPDISVVTTSEVHSELVLRGWQEHVADGGSNFKGPSLISLALIAFTSYSLEGLTAYEQSRQFGNRTGAYAISYGLGAFANYGIGAAIGDSMAGVPFLSLVVASVSRVTIGTGLQKYDKLKAMNDLVANNDEILNRLRLRLV